MVVLILIRRAVLLVLIILTASLSSIMVVAEGSDRVQVESFDPTYYMNGKDTTTINTMITIIGDDLKGNDIPVQINFYEENGVDLLNSYVVDEELIDYQTGVNGGKPVYKYKDYTGEFGFDTEKNGMVTFRLVIIFNNFQDHNRVYNVHVNIGTDPILEEPSHNTKIISGTLIILIVVILVISMATAGVAVKYSRKNLASETHVGLDIEAEDTEINVCLEDDSFKKVPAAKRGPVTLKSQTSQSEIDMD